MKTPQFLTQFELTEYIDSWRLVSTTEEFDKVLTYLNLAEYKRFSGRKLNKSDNIKDIYLCLFLESPLKEISNRNVDIQGTFRSKKNALEFLQKTSEIIAEINKDALVPPMFGTVRDSLLGRDSGVLKNSNVFIYTQNRFLK